MKAALAIGGTSALMAAKARAHNDHDQPTPGPNDDLPARQYAWDDFSEINERTGLAKFPKHHLQFMLDYVGDGTPTDAERDQVEEALKTLERAFEWSHEGLMFTLGYSPAYFDRYEKALPDETGLGRPETVIEESDIRRSGNIAVDDYDAHLHLASDTVIALLEAEAALFGEAQKIGPEGNEVGVTERFEDVFSTRDRRTGFIGNPHERWDEDISGENPVDEDASVWFGFDSLFTDSQPTEDEINIDGAHLFAGGTTEQVSVLRDEGIREWYEQHSLEDRVDRMFSPEHDVADTGEHGRELGATSGTEDKSMVEIAAETEEDAEEKGVVGHSQKLARVRKGENDRPPLLRRDFPSTDGNQVHTQFISLQRFIDDFIDVRKHMAFVDPESDKPADSEVPMKNHGIQGHFQVESRGTFLIPPRKLRALPPPRP